MIEHEHGFDLFGTRLRLLVTAPSGTRLDARIAALRVQARLTRIHRALSRFEPESELCQLNTRAGTPVSASQTMLEAIAAALHAAHVSEGLVDPTLLPQLEQAGYAHSRVGLADLAAAIAAAPARRSAAAHPAGTWRQIELDRAAGTVRLPAGTRLDLGGSAKGMAVDIAARMLANAPAFAVDARKWIGAKTWRWLHRWTIAVYVLALGHAVGAGTNGRSTWMLAILTILTAPIVFAFTYRLLPRPARSGRPARPAAPRVAAET